MIAFEVVAMAMAPPEHIRLFARHYLRCGAKKVTVYLDRVTEPLIDTIDGLELVVCDEAFWSRIRTERHFHVEDRQRAIYNYHYQQSKAEWLLRVDIDELVIGSPNLDVWLGQVPCHVMAVQVRTAEAVFREDDDIDADFSARNFRLQFGKYTAPIASRILYGLNAPFFTRGLLGHCIGKQFIRTKQRKFYLDIHHASCSGEKIRPMIADRHVFSPSIYLAHFDAISFDRWRDKLDRRIQCNDLLESGFNVKREKQKLFYQTVREQGLKQTRKFFLKMYGLNKLQRFFLKATGKLLEADELRVEIGRMNEHSDLSRFNHE